MQKDEGALKSVSTQQKEVMLEFALETITVLQMASFDVTKLVTQVESVYIQAQRRTVGLFLLAQVFNLAHM